jgi:hypothetical protein
VAEITTNPVPVVKTEMTRQQRAAIKTFGQFVIAIEEAFPQEAEDTSNVAKKLTRSGLQMADRLVHTQHGLLLRNVIDSTAKSAAPTGQIPKPPSGHSRITAQSGGCLSRTCVRLNKRPGRRTRRG